MANVTIMDQDARITYTTRLDTTTCGVCGVPFAIPADMLARAKRDPDEWIWCPNGHKLHWPGPSEADELREQLEASLSRARMAEEASRRNRETSLMHKRQAAAYKGQLTRARKRAGAGVCPVTECHRTVRQLADHMATKHPGYTP